MRIEDIRRVLIVGAGARGQEVSWQCARYGYEVVLYDTLPAALEIATARHQAFLTRLVAEGQLMQVAKAILGRITTTIDPDQAASKVDLLNESIPEESELKAKLFAQFNELCPPHAIFTTNTSAHFWPSLLAKATGRPAQFATFYFHHEVWMSNMVDIIPHPATAEETVELLYAFAKRIGQRPIIHGY